VLQHGPDENNTKTRGERIARVIVLLLFVVHIKTAEEMGGERIDGGRNEAWTHSHSYVHCLL
jgi:hypothetical protein